LKTGAAAEQLAAAFLARKGLKLIEANYRCRFGEIDLVLRDGDTIVFAEVRLRSSDRFGGAAYSVDRRKQARLVAAARRWLAGKKDPPCRFDVVLMDRLDASRIEWIRDAFSS
jgi:putative endonuclease